MDPLDLARWQFGATTVYHFLFVPLTIGLVFLVAGFQTVWVRTGDERWLRLTRFFGKLFGINFAIGIVTGLVQEFQFGMNWSDYSRFVGDVFGAPLAIEGLLAFFLEATFLGLWIFGWNRLPRLVHLATIWIVAVGTLLSAYFILAANSWMQHPVGYRINPASGRAELTDIVAVLTSDVTLAAFFHTVAACFLIGGALVTGVSLWHIMRRPLAEGIAAFRSATKVGALTTLVAAGALALSGDTISKIMFRHQPMKMAAAEGLSDTARPAGFSILTIGPPDGSTEWFSLKVPNLLSFLATGSFDGKVAGINQLQAAAEQTHGPENYTPFVPVTYWSYRAMIGVGMLAALIALIVLWRTRGGRTPRSRLLLAGGMALPLLPLVASSAGWVFTEMGRQPWLVYGQLRTASGVSPGTTTAEVLTSLIVFTLLYGALGFIEVKLFLTAARGPLPEPDPPQDRTSPDAAPAMAY